MKFFFQALKYCYHAVFYTVKIYVRRKIFKASLTDIWNDAQRWASVSLADFHVKVEVVGNLPDANARPYVIIPNHRSWFDHITFMHVLSFPFHAFGKEDFFKIPVLGILAKLVEFIPVKGKKIEPKEREDIHKYLSQKESILLFIEGTRGAGQTLLPFRPGAFHYSVKYDVPLLPVYILGSEQILSKERPFSSLRSGTIFVVFDEPFKLSKEDMDKQFAEFESKYRKRHDELYIKYVKEVWGDNYV